MAAPSDDGTVPADADGPIRPLPAEDASRTETSFTDRETAPADSAVWEAIDLEPADDPELIGRGDAAAGDTHLPPPPPAISPSRQPRAAEGRERSPRGRSRPSRPAASPAIERDRIVVLGRRRAGKTIFLARLYETLWRSESRLHMRTVEGNDHLFFMETLRVLSERVWPPATGGSTRIRMEVSIGAAVRPLSVLDYSGEVFKRAFLEGETSDPDAAELLEHLDRAAAVILLVDPGVALTGTPEEIAEDEFGMTAAVRRIRQSPGGSHIPIALVLTKLDLHGRVVRECGGLVAFVKRHLFPLLRALHRVRVFGCVAVRSRPDALGVLRPDPSTPPQGIVEPLEFCLQRMVAAEASRTSVGALPAASQQESMALPEDGSIGEEARPGLNAAGIAVIAVAAVAILGIAAAAIWLLLQTGGQV